MLINSNLDLAKQVFIKLLMAFILCFTYSLSNRFLMILQLIDNSLYFRILLTFFVIEFLNLSQLFH